jgi:hypothetical protein
MLALGIIWIGRELHIERSARCDYPQILVENDQRFANGVYHCLRKGTGVFNLTAGIELAAGISTCSGIYSAAGFSSNGQYETEPYVQLDVAYVFGNPWANNNCLGAGAGPGGGLGVGILSCRTSVIFSRTYTGP